MRVGIVGGGISGLAALHHLRERGVDATLFEASDQPGGVVRSTRVEGRVLERGPQRTRLTTAIESLVDDCGLRDELRTATDGRLYVYRDGELRVAPQSPRQAVGTSLFSVRGKLRALAEPLTGPPKVGETVQSYFRRSFGREVADNFLAPLYAGLYASDPAEMPVEHSAAKALQKTGPTDSVLVNVLRAKLAGKSKPAVASFDDGLHRLPQALAARHDDAVRLSTPVEAIRERRDGYVVETAGSVSERFDRVVVTTPADTAAELLDGVASEAARRLDELRFNSMVVVHLLARDADALTGSGFQVPHDEPLATLGTTWNASMLDRDGVYTAYLGGAKNPDLLEWPDDRIATTAAEEFESVTGVAVDPVNVDRIRPGMPAYDTTWDVLEGLETPEDVHLCTNYLSRAGIPGRVRDAEALAERLAELTEPETVELASTTSRPVATASIDD